MIAFPGTGNWPIRLAQDKGYFAQSGIEVTLTPTPNSVFQITKFAQGDFDIAMTAIDNVIAYMEGQGEVPLPLPPDFVVFMGGSPSIPSLATVPEVTDYQALKGKTLAVDATTTKARCQLLEEREDIATLQLPTDNHLAVSINAMDLKNGFRNVETDCDRLHV